MSIKKKTCLIAMMCLLLLHTKVQGQVPGKNYVSIGAGFPNLPRFFFNTLSSKDKFTSSGTGPYHLKYENRVYSWLGLGVSINHMTYKVSYKENVLDTANGIIVPNQVEISNNNTAVNLRSNFHFINPEKYEHLDVYMGLGFGYRFGKLRISSEYQGYTPSIKLPGLSKLGAEVTFGMRYFIDKNIGFYTELGIAKSIVQAGLTARF